MMWHYCYITRRMTYDLTASIFQFALLVFSISFIDPHPQKWKRSPTTSSFLCFSWYAACFRYFVCHKKCLWLPSVDLSGGNFLYSVVHHCLANKMSRVTWPFSKMLKKGNQRIFHWEWVWDSVVIILGI